MNDRISLCDICTKDRGTTCLQQSIVNWLASGDIVSIYLPAKDTLIRGFYLVLRMETPNSALGCDGFEACIVVDGEQCTQYGVEYEEGDAVSGSKASCWIASTADKVRIQSAITIKLSSLIAWLVVIHCKIRKRGQ